MHWPFTFVKPIQTWTLSADQEKSFGCMQIFSGEERADLPAQTFVVVVVTEDVHHVSSSANNGGQATVSNIWPKYRFVHSTCRHYTSDFENTFNIHFCDKWRFELSSTLFGQAPAALSMTTRVIKLNSFRLRYM